MDIFFEILFECLLSGAVEGSKWQKLPKGVRIILGLFVVFVFAAVIGLIVLAGVLSLKENIALSIFMFALAGFMGFMAFWRAAKARKEAVQQEQALHAGAEENS